MDDPTSFERVSIWKRWHTAGWALGYAALALGLQFKISSAPYDEDSAYHVAVGRLIHEHGLLRSFPWTPFSWLADHYADKELLLHLLLAPLSGLEWITAAKLVAALLEAALLLSLYWVLRRERVWGAGLWALAPLLVCEVFVFRFSLLRPHLMSIALVCLLLWAAARRRVVAVAVLSALFPLCYIAWQLPLVAVFFAELAQVLAGRRVNWRTGAAAVLGLLLGLALHPNGLELIRLNWIVLVDILLKGAWGGAAQFELGKEFGPFTPAEWARWLVLVTAVVVAAGVLAWRTRRNEPIALAYTLAAVAFGLLTVRTARFAEYFVPLSVAALALASAAWRPRAMLGLVLLAGLGYTAPAKVETIKALGARREKIPPALATWLQERIPVGAQVFSCEWGYTGSYLLALPERRFIVALDPTLFYIKDPELYLTWYRLPREAPLESAQIVRERFGARFVLCAADERFRKFFMRLAGSRGVKTLLIDEQWMLFELEQV